MSSAVKLFNLTIKFAQSFQVALVSHGQNDLFWTLAPLKVVSQTTITQMTGRRLYEKLLWFMKTRVLLAISQKWTWYEFDFFLVVRHT